MSYKYDESEWIDACDGRPLAALDRTDLLVLHRHWVWADVIHQAHTRTLVEAKSIEELANPASANSAYMFVFYGLLYSVVEACISPDEKREIPIAGRFREDIDSVSDTLRRCRNAVMHVPKSGNDYLDPRLQQFMATPDIIERVTRIHNGFSRLFLDEFAARKK